ncbi:MAG: c-type cytochrome [Longimicrobiales bacterium]
MKLRAMPRFLLITGCAVLAPLPAARVAAQSDSARSSGAIAAAQAKRGEATFKETCAACHATAQFNTAAFARSWNERPVFELFDQLRSNMPQDNPGGLTRQQYLDVVLYLFKLNGAAEGERELAPDDDVMKSTRIKLNGR